MLIGGATRTLCYLVLISVAYCGIGHCTSRHYLRVTITLLLTRPVHWSGASRWGGLKFTSQYKRWLRAKSRCTVQVEEMVEGKERASGEGFPYTVASVGPTPCTVASGSGWPLRKAYSSSQPSMVNWLSSPTFPCLFVVPLWWHLLLILPLRWTPPSPSSPSSPQSSCSKGGVKKLSPPQKKIKKRKFFRKWSEIARKSVIRLFWNWILYKSADDHINLSKSACSGTFMAYRTIYTINFNIFSYLALICSHLPEDDTKFLPKKIALIPASGVPVNLFLECPLWRKETLPLQH